MTMRMTAVSSQNNERREVRSFMNTIGQYYCKTVNGAPCGHKKVTSGFESYDRVFYTRRATVEGGSAPPALFYDRTDGFYVVGRERETRGEDGTVMVRHGFLFPSELFRKAVFGSKLYHFFDIDDFDCTPAGFDAEETPSAKTNIHVAENASDFLRPEDIFRRGREKTRFVKLLLYAMVLAVTEHFSLVFSLPDMEGERYDKNAVLFLKSLFAMVPWEWREYLTFHSYVNDPVSFGAFRLSVTPLPVASLPHGNKTFYFDLRDMRVSPDLVIEQKTRGTLIGDLLFLIWSNGDEQALSSLFYLVHHNRNLLTGDLPQIIQMDALCCYFLLTGVGAKYREYLHDQRNRLSKGTSREILLFLAGHLQNSEFVRLREMLDL